MEMQEQMIRRTLYVERNLAVTDWLRFSLRFFQATNRSGHAQRFHKVRGVLLGDLVALHRAAERIKFFALFFAILQRSAYSVLKLTDWRKTRGRCSSFVWLLCLWPRPRPLPIRRWSSTRVLGTARAVLPPDAARTPSASTARRSTRAGTTEVPSASLIPGGE